MTFKGIGLDKLKDWVKAYVAEALSSQGGGIGCVSGWRYLRLHGSHLSL